MKPKFRGGFLYEKGYGTPPMEPYYEMYYGKYTDLIKSAKGVEFKYHPYIGSSRFCWSDYPMGDPNDPSCYATEIGESREQAKSEIVAVIYNCTNWTFYGDYGIVFWRITEIPDPRPQYFFQYPRTKVAEFIHNFPNPQDLGFDYYKNAAIYGWLGKFSDEINTVSHYKTPQTWVPSLNMIYVELIGNPYGEFNTFTVADDYPSDVLKNCFGPQQTDIYGCNTVSNICEQGLGSLPAGCNGICASPTITPTSTLTITPTVTPTITPAPTGNNTLLYVTGIVVLAGLTYYVIKKNTAK